MDRKAWIVVTLCVIGMVLNGWWMVNHPPAPAPAAAQVIYLTERGGLMWGNVGKRVLRSYGTTDSLDLRAGQALQQVFVGDFVAR